MRGFKLTLICALCSNKSSFPRFIISSSGFRYQSELNVKTHTHTHRTEHSTLSFLNSLIRIRCTRTSTHECKQRLDLCTSRINRTKVVQVVVSRRIYFVERTVVRMKLLVADSNVCYIVSAPVTPCRGN